MHDGRNAGTSAPPGMHHRGITRHRRCPCLPPRLAVPALGWPHGKAGAVIPCGETGNACLAGRCELGRGRADAGGHLCRGRGWRGTLLPAGKGGAGTPTGGGGLPRTVSCHRSGRPCGLAPLRASADHHRGGESSHGERTGARGQGRQGQVAHDAVNDPALKGRACHPSQGCPVRPVGVQVDQPLPLAHAPGAPSRAGRETDAGVLPQPRPLEPFRERRPGLAEPRDGGIAERRRQPARDIGEGSERGDPFRHGALTGTNGSS